MDNNVNENNGNNKLIKYLTDELVKEKIKNSELNNKLSNIAGLKLHIEENPNFEALLDIQKKIPLQIETALNALSNTSNSKLNYKLNYELNRHNCDLNNNL